MRGLLFKRLISGLSARFDMAGEDAASIVDEIKNIFRDQEEIEDSIISKEVRTLFYALQDEGLMKVRREEVKVKGEPLPMRLYYWSVNEPKEERKERKDEDNIYDTVPPEVWRRRR